MKQRMRKRLQGLLLCICLLAGLLPDYAYAAQAGESVETQESPDAGTKDKAGGNADEGSAGDFEKGEAAENGESTSDGEIINESVFVNLSAGTKEDGTPVMNALTGEMLKAVVYAYNDNPNATALATIRIYVKQTKGSQKIAPKDTHKQELKLQGIGGKPVATTVEAVWHLPGEAEDPSDASVTNSGSDPDSKNAYLEMALPAGASLSLEIELYCPTGYDELASAQVYCEVDEDGLDTVTFPENEADRVSLYWEGEAKWSNFKKSVDITTIGCEEGVITPEKVNYSFGAQNDLNRKTGIIYTKEIRIEDELVLPKGLHLPENIRVDKARGRVETNDGTELYAISVKNYAYTMNSLAYKKNDAGQDVISYCLTIPNPEITDTAFNPVSAVTAALSVGNLTVSDGITLEDAQILNSAKLQVNAVDSEGGSGSKMIYEDKNDAKIRITEKGMVDISKEAFSVTDGKGVLTYGKDAVSSDIRVQDGKPVVMPGYMVTYQVTLSNSFEYAHDATMTDLIPEQMELSEDSLSVKEESSGKELVKDKDYTVSFQKKDSGETELTVYVKEIPGEKGVTITYNCKVLETVTDNLDIENVARVNDKEAGVTVHVPEEGTARFEKEVICRRTENIVGSPLIIWKTPDGRYQVSGDYMGYFGSYPTQEELKEALLTVNAGDKIEYLITYDNQTFHDISGVVYDYEPFSSSINQGLYMGMSTGGWAYYISGLDRYMTGNSSGSSGSGSSSVDSNKVREVFGSCIYNYSDFASSAANANASEMASLLQGSGTPVWRFETRGKINRTLRSGTTYRQTMVLEIPGDNKESSASYVNKEFQNLAASYAYSVINRGSGSASNVHWQTYAEFKKNESETHAQNLVSSIYEHKAAAQMYLNTGTVASCVVDDVNNIKDGDIREAYSQWGGSSFSERDYTNSAKYFQADDNTVVVNYVYLYNDSAEPIRLDDYELQVALPRGFTWLGFVSPCTVSSTGSLSYRGYKRPQSGCYVSDYFGTDNLRVNNTRNNSPFAFNGSRSSDNSAYYNGYESRFSETQSQFPAKSSNFSYTDYVNAGISFSLYSSSNELYTIRSNNWSPEIRPYSGVVFMYAAKADAATVRSFYTGKSEGSYNAAATFRAAVRRTYNNKYSHGVSSAYMPQISPVIRPQDNYSTTQYSSGSRQYVSNDGNANTYLEHQLDRCYPASSSALYWGTSASSGKGGVPYYMWSYVNLSMNADQTKVSVKKSVVKNSGQESEDQYSNDAENRKTQKWGGPLNCGYHTDYDDYQWYYPLHDGIHRTVDGTVTWKMTVTNEGYNGYYGPVQPGMASNYGAVNYSTLVDTVDSPYHLKEIAVPVLNYLKQEGENYTAGPTYKWVYYEIPDSNPENPQEMTDEGWRYHPEADCYTFEALGRSKDEMFDTLELATYSGMAIPVRVTLRRLADKSIGYGYDVDQPGGNQNKAAYQYVIEFLDQISGFQPLLATRDKESKTTPCSMDFYLTFSTDDSIETNYNSFALAFPDANIGTVNDYVESATGRKMPAEQTHNGAGILSNGEETSVYKAEAEDIAEAADSRDIAEAADAGDTGDNAEAADAGDTGDNAEAADTGDTAEITGNAQTGIMLLSYIGGGTSDKDKGYAVIPSNAVIVEHSDWTDTSYTDGEKTISILDKDGETVSSVNNRADGNMVLPAKVVKGDKIHSTLKVESILRESENYSDFHDLVIYDTYGVKETEPVKCGYTVDLSTIVVQQCLSADIAKNQAEDLNSTQKGFHASRLVLGTDYDIYYTETPLVTKEHHPISPVNTLTYAADLENLEADTTQWIKYDPEQKQTGENAKAFKIVMRSDGAAGKIYNGKIDSAHSDWMNYEVYVDYDATVAVNVKQGDTYPNVLAWTASVQDKDNPEKVKQIREDTTAMYVEAIDGKIPSFIKKVTDESGKDISKETKQTFTYMIVRTNSTSSWLSELKKENVTGVALAVVPAGEKVTLDDKNLRVVYNTYQEGDDTAETFWKQTSYYYYVIELDSKGYLDKGVNLQSMSGVGDSGTRTMKLNLAEIETTDETANQFFDDQNEAKTARFYLEKDVVTWYAELVGTNQYQAPQLMLKKTDTEGNTIWNEVSFQMTDSAGGIIRFEPAENGYVYTEDADSQTAVDTLTFSGRTVIDGLPQGTYTLTETAPPQGYLAGEAVEVQVDAGMDNAACTISIKNEEDPKQHTGTFKLVKTDYKSKEAVTGRTAGFQIYKSREADAQPLGFLAAEDTEGNVTPGRYAYETEAGKELQTKVFTDAQTGELEISGLPYGTYYLVETDAPEGYMAAHAALEDAMEFTVAREAAIFRCQFENEYVEAEVSVKKVDEEGNAITGNPAAFQLQTVDGIPVAFEGSSGAYEYKTGGTVTELLTSAKDGTLTLTKLPKGSYSLVETMAPKGYAVSEAKNLVIENNDKQTIRVEDKTAPAAIRIEKRWQLENGRKTYPLSGVSFVLYMEDKDGAAAEEIARGVTDAGGSVVIADELDWKKKYYLYEELPEGYSRTGDMKVLYKNDQTGDIDLSVTEATEGYTALECIEVDIAKHIMDKNSDGQDVCTFEDGVWVFRADVLNIKNMIYGGLYASTSYKTISNAKSAEKYDALEPEVGYSYFHTPEDYLAGNYNYVHAIKNGDIVTYTLNISNVSDYEFADLVLIDRMPEPDDTGVVNLDEKRGSEFTVGNVKDDMHVAVDGKEIPKEQYTVEFSDKVQYTDSDFDGTGEWKMEPEDAGTKSFRVVFAEDFRLYPGSTVVVTFDGAVKADAKPGEIAWNNFAYRYRAFDDQESGTKKTQKNVVVKEAEKGKVLTPEPPKVGVMITEKEFTATKKWEDTVDGIEDKLGFRPDALKLKLQIQDADGNLTDTEVENSEVTLRVTENQGVESIHAEAGEHANIVAELGQDGSWKCSWKGLPALDDGFSYTVEEAEAQEGDLDNYISSVHVADDGNSAEIVNTLKLGKIRLLKKKDTEEAGVPGAVFTIEKGVKDSTTGIMNWTLMENGTYTTDVDGQIEIENLPKGSYRITETKTQEGLSLLKEPLIVELPLHYTAKEVEEKGLDTTGDNVVRVGDDYYYYELTYTITNTAKLTVPDTGGRPGTVWPTAAAGVIMLAGAWMVLRRRRQEISS